MSNLNIEIKARCSDAETIRKQLMSWKATVAGTDHQVDTYFNVPYGRLKLREGTIENYLVHYSRENIAGPKQSRVSLYETVPGSSLKDLLTAALGVLAVVDKTREIYFVENVKFHLDTVAGLGSFMEIEAIDRDGSLGEDTLYRQCRHYMEALGIREDDLLELSYSDLILDKADQVHP